MPIVGRAQGLAHADVEPRRLRADEPHRAIDDIVHPHGLDHERCRARERQQFIDDALNARDFAADQRTEVLPELGIMVPFGQELGKGLEGGQRILDFMRHAGGEGPDAGQPVRLPHLILEPLDGGVIVDDQDGAEEIVAFAGKRQAAHEQMRLIAGGRPQDDLFIPGDSVPNQGGRDEPADIPQATRSRLGVELSSSCSSSRASGLTTVSVPCGIGGNDSAGQVSRPGIDCTLGFAAPRYKAASSQWRHAKLLGNQAQNGSPITYRKSGRKYG